jgi:hypothetical protein
MIVIKRMKTINIKTILETKSSSKFIIESTIFVGGVDDII